MKFKRLIDCEYACFDCYSCWFEFETPEEVTQSCMYHNGRLLMRGDVMKTFDRTEKSPSSKKK